MHQIMSSQRPFTSQRHQHFHLAGGGIKGSQTPTFIGSPIRLHNLSRLIRSGVRSSSARVSVMELGMLLLLFMVVKLTTFRAEWQVFSLSH
jgi:hypothetical protein